MGEIKSLHHSQKGAVAASSGDAMNKEVAMSFRFVSEKNGRWDEKQIAVD